VTNTELGFTVQQKEPVLSISQTKPVQVEITGHGMSNGKWVRATNFFRPPHSTGMYELNNRLFQIGNVTDDTFDLFDQEGEEIDGTGYTAYIVNTMSQFTLTGPTLNTENLNTQEG